MKKLRLSNNFQDYFWNIMFMLCTFLWMYILLLFV